MATILVWLVVSVNHLQAGQSQAGREQLEDSIRKAAVACYAAEGVYPPDLAYLCEHYGIQIQQERYLVFYEIFADNLMPEITVVEKVS